MKHCALFGISGRTRWRNRQVLILGYHGISVEDEHEWNPELYVSPNHLEKRLQTLRQVGCTILTLDSAVAGLYSGSLPERSIVLTFDDGLLDFYKVGYPILKSHSAEATVYLTTYYSEDNRPVLGITADYILWKQRSRTVRLTSIPDLDRSLDLQKPAVRKAAGAAIRKHADSARMSADEKHDLLRRVAVDTGFDFDRFCEKRLLHVMTPSEARELAALGVDFQLHTHRHRVPLDETLFRREILDNRSRIEAITGRSCHHFCYPSGEYSQKVLPWLRSMNVKSATTCDPGICSTADEPLLLPRLLDQGTLSQVEFEAWCCGAAPALRSWIYPLRKAAVCV